MVCRNTAEVDGVLAIYDRFKDRSDLDGLAVSLPHLRRPRGREGEYDVARLRALPPALRAASVFFTYRAEVNNGGVDQFVYNQLSILPETIEAFMHIGAHSAAGFLVELGDALLADSDMDGDAVQNFLTFRAAVANVGWEGGGEIDEVEEALVAHARAHAEEFVVETIDHEEWSNDCQRFRASVVRRPDDRYEVVVEMQITGAGEKATWRELSRPAELHSLDEARERRTVEIRSRRECPKECSFVVSSSSTEDDAIRLWMQNRPPLDCLPVGSPLALTFVRGEETLRARGRFEADVSLVGDRAYGRVLSDKRPPDTEKWPPLEPRWRLMARVLEG